MQRSLAVLLALTLPAGPLAANPPVPPPEVANLRVGLLVDVNSGRTLYARQPNLRFVPASMAKVMTAYLILKRYPLSADGNGFTLTVSPQQAASGMTAARRPADSSSSRAARPLSAAKRSVKESAHTHTSGVPRAGDPERSGRSENRGRLRRWSTPAAALANRPTTVLRSRVFATRGVNFESLATGDVHGDVGLVVVTFYAGLRRQRSTL